jgi:hypothetical protein
MGGASLSSLSAFLMPLKNFKYSAKQISERKQAIAFLLNFF